MTPRLVSICIPVYNVEKYIERCAISLFEQSYKYIEYLFINDCSQDSSIERLEELIKRYPQRINQIRIISLERNLGLSAVRNIAVHHCIGEFIIHVDSDDYLDINAVDYLIKKQNETDADIVTGQAICMQKDRLSMMERPHFLSRQEFIMDMIQPSIHHTIWGRLIRKQLYIDNKIKAKEGVNIGEDLQVMTQLAYYAKKIESIWDVVYYYDCTNDLSYMNQYDLKHIKRLLQDTESMQVVRDFFVDKDRIYLNCAERFLYKYYIELLRFYGRSKDKDNYKRIRTLLLNLCPENRQMSRKQRIKYDSYLSFRISEMLPRIVK